MGNFTVVGEIGEILVELLKSGFQESKEFSEQSVEIVLGVPEVPDSVTLRVIVFLYHIDRNAERENQCVFNPKLVLELHYLLIAFAKDDKAFEHKMAGKIAEILNDHMILAVDGFKEKPGFTGAGYPVTVNMVQMTLDEKYKLWTAFPKITDKTFLPYVARPVTISGKPDIPRIPVTSREYIIKNK